MKMIDLKEFEHYISTEYLKCLEERQSYEVLGIDPDPDDAICIETSIQELLVVGKWLWLFHIDNK